MSAALVELECKVPGALYTQSFDPSTSSASDTVRTLYHSLCNEPLIENQGYPFFTAHSGKKVCFSHSLDAVLVAVFEPWVTQLGADLELRAVDPKVSQRFHPNEQLTLSQLDPVKRAACVQRLWSLKEAYVKAKNLTLFEGMRADFSTAPVLSQPNVKPHEQLSFSAHGLQFISLEKLCVCWD